MSTSTARAAPPDTKPITNGWDGQANKPIVVGYAPLAPRPDWLPKSGPGQQNVRPLCWSLSVEQWIRLVNVCVTTDTWKELAKEKGEYKINMYDVNEHFVKPWTQGTGCSIALLMNAEQQLEAEGMFSHAWAGSVVETYNCLQNMVNKLGVPATARFYFCTFSNYQHDDGAFGAPTINEQVAMNPFVKVIESKPKYGILVLHTTVYEVYKRLWVTHEADVGQQCNVQMRGLFDMYRWTASRFEASATVKTREGKCGVEQDRAYIDGLIQDRGGYERLDRVIVDFRARMLHDLKALLRSCAPEQEERSESDVQGCYGHHESHATKMDWERGESGTENLMSLSGSDYGYGWGRWRYKSAWTSTIYEHKSPEELHEFNELDTLMQRFEQLTEREASATLVAAEAFQRRMQRRQTAWPLGAASYPLGEERSWSWGDAVEPRLPLPPSWEAQRRQRELDDYKRREEARKVMIAEAEAKRREEKAKRRAAIVMMCTTCGQKHQGGWKACTKKTCDECKFGFCIRTRRPTEICYALRPERPTQDNTEDANGGNLTRAGLQFIQKAWDERKGEGVQLA